MSLTERQRHAADEALVSTFGDQTASVITMLKTDTHEFLTTEEFRLAMARVDTQFAELRVDCKHEINEAFGAQTRTLVIGLMSAVFLITVTNVLAFLVG